MLTAFSRLRSFRKSQSLSQTQRWQIGRLDNVPLAHTPTQPLGGVAACACGSRSAGRLAVVGLLVGLCWLVGWYSAAQRRLPRRACHASLAISSQRGVQRQLGGWQCSANPRAAAVGMCVVPPPSGPGTPLPSSWRCRHTYPVVQSRAGRVPLRAFPGAAARAPGASGGGGLDGHPGFPGFYLVARAVPQQPAACRCGTRVASAQPSLDACAAAVEGVSIAPI